MANEPAILTRVATVEVMYAKCVENSDSGFNCQMKARCRDSELTTFDGRGQSREQAVAATVSQFCFRAIAITKSTTDSLADGRFQTIAAITEQGHGSGRAGVGRFIADQADTSLIVATLRAVNHGGLLKAAYRANNQKVLRGWSRELIQELSDALGLDSLDVLKRLEAEGIVLKYMNRVASAAVVTAANHPRPNSILSLFDTSAWLFDNQGGLRWRGFDGQSKCLFSGESARSH